MIPFHPVKQIKDQTTVQTRVFRRANLLSTRPTRYDHSHSPVSCYPQCPLKTLNILKPRAHPSSGATWASSSVYMKRRSRTDPTCALALTLFGARALSFAKDLFFAGRALCAPTLAQTIRAYYLLVGNWRSFARMRPRKRFARVICGKGLRV